MKNSFKSMLCALALSTSVAFAGPGDAAERPSSFTAGIYQTIDGGIAVNLEKKAPVTAAVLVLNANGDVLVREGIGRKQNKAAIKFDVSALKDGAYKIAVVSRNEKVIKEFTITSEQSVVKRELTFD